MKRNRLRNWALILHRLVGLAIGFLLVIVGITGSLLVFRKEWDDWLVRLQFGTLTPQAQLLPTEKLVDAVKAAYINYQGAIPSYVSIPPDATTPYTIGLQMGEKSLEVFVNQFTGEVLGDRQWETSLVGLLFDLHIRLFAGEPGLAIVGIAALLSIVLSFTGLALWPGWQKLIAGFKVKLNAHPKRKNFDIHKIIGIITAFFLILIAFTGFCWNFADKTEPIIYSLTSSPKPPETTSHPIAGKSPIPLNVLLQKASAALPGTRTLFISLPSTPTDTLWSMQSFSQEPIEAERQTRIYLDRYSGEVLYIKNALQSSLGDRILNWFHPLHYGTFWGLPSRILYVFVGLAPLILLITGLNMYRYRKWGKAAKQEAISHSQKITPDD
jgi:uncharacterized iron-regulated membrane protein